MSLVACELDCFGDTSCGCYMVVFDQHSVKEPEAVIRSHACLYSVFVKEPEAWRGFPGVGYPRPESFYGFHIFIGKGGDTGKSLEDVECCPFSGQQAAGAALDRCHNCFRLYMAAFFFQCPELFHLTWHTQNNQTFVDKY